MDNSTEAMIAIGIALEKSEEDNRHLILNQQQDAIDPRRFSYPATHVREYKGDGECFSAHYPDTLEA